MTEINRSLDETSTPKICSCGKGHRSSYDGKCGNCRTREEQKEYVRKHVNNDFQKVAK